MTALGELSISEVNSQITSGSLSVKEVLTFVYDSALKNKDLNCFITLPDLAKKIEEAEIVISKAQKSGSASATSLLGVPVPVKDMICTLGEKTTCASKILENYVSPYEATCVEKMKSRGAIPFGKTNHDQFGMGSSSENSHFGAVRNPWNPEYVPGGSSGGSAAVVAAGIAQAALGTDTGGSSRLPASFCGIVGIKPTYGRISRYGVIAYASSLDQVGVMARRVEDAALVLEAVSGFDSNDSTSIQLEVPRYAEELKLADKKLKGLRIGVPKEYFIEGIDKEVLESIKAVIKYYESHGAEIVDISLPHTEYALACYYIIAPAEAASNLARYDGVRYTYRAKECKDLQEMYIKSRSEAFGSEVKKRIIIGNYVLSSGYFDEFYSKAQKVRRLIKNDFDLALKTKCDLIISPVAPSTAFKLGEKSHDPLKMYLTDIFTITVNLIGAPGISVPCGFDSKGLPIGFQLIGKAFDESTLLQTAYAYEQNNPWWKKRPARI